MQLIDNQYDEHHTEGKFYAKLYDKVMRQVSLGKDIEELLLEESGTEYIYQLSAVRENIINWYPFSDEDKILEVGAGCGAITRCLLRSGASVTAIDESQWKCRINELINGNCDRLQLISGQFEAVLNSLPIDYTAIVVVGHFEYATVLGLGDNPEVEYLSRLRKHLADDGKLILATNNQFGLQYFAGRSDDYTGEPFQTIQGYPNHIGPRCYGRKQLVEYFDKAGYEVENWYYPYPDFELPTMVFSEEYIQNVSDLNTNVRNFRHSRYVLYDENKVLKTLIQSDIYTELANSFMIVASARNVE